MHDAAHEEARLLLQSLSTATGNESLAGVAAAAAARVEPRSDLARWADSGAMALTGPAAGPPLAPAGPVASRLVGAGAVLAELTRTCGGPVVVDVPALLGERATLRGLRRHGQISAGGGCHLLETVDGWIAVTLIRPDDWDLLPAWVGVTDADWPSLATALRTEHADALAERGTELGLAVAVLPAGPRPDDDQYVGHRAGSPASGPWVVTPSRTSEPVAVDGARVVDLSALWAGPLCASLLRLAGAHVVTIESTTRPDGARRGDPALHRLLHAGHEFVSVDLHDAGGRDELCRLVDDADIVVTAARPRALQQLGLDPVAAVTGRPGLTWVAINGYGMTGPWCNRPAYGDDAAVAGGLVVREPQPMFCGDAIADPATGVYAAIAAVAVARSGGGLVDIALRDVAAHLAREPHIAGARPATSYDGDWVVSTDDGVVSVQPPRARTAVVHEAVR